MEAVVGHSFGELTALCVSGCLSLVDTMRLIAGRAQVIQNDWGTEKGAMLAVEADLSLVEALLAESREGFSLEPPPTIACFNGPRSFTLAGSIKAIELVAEKVAGDFVFAKSMKIKKLNVTNAFHSTLVDPLMKKLELLGKNVDFKAPTISVERATKFGTSQELKQSFIADHMRNPVYFDHAMQRLHKRFESAIFLEAGSNSTITTMAKKALGSPKSCHFLSINLSNEDSLSQLTDTTTKLWSEGLNVAFWPHHPIQSSDYESVLLPPYQFEKSRHWMELKKPKKSLPTPTSTIQPSEEPPKGLWTFVGFQSHDKRKARFRVNTMTEKFQNYLLGHVVAQTAPLCSSVVQLEIIVEALLSLRPSGSMVQPQIQKLESHNPMSLDPSRVVWLDAEVGEMGDFWEFKMISQISNDNSRSTLHVSGKMLLHAANDPKLTSEFAKYERLVGSHRCHELLNGKDVDEIIQGRNIYKTFRDIVRYDGMYKGLQKLVSKGTESAGRVVKRFTGETNLDAGLFDSFCQVAGIYVNCMTDIHEDDMYISDRIEQWIRSPKLCKVDSWPSEFDVFASQSRPSNKEYVSDLFIFDPRNGALLEVILGVHYQFISRGVMRKVLERVYPGAKAPTSVIPPVAPLSPDSFEPVKSAAFSPDPGQAVSEKSSPKNTSSKAPSADISSSVKSLVSNLSGVDPEEITNDSGLGDLGIDSLMGMELAREIEVTFKCALDTAELNDLTDFNSLIKCIEKTMGVSDVNEPTDENINSGSIGNSEVDEKTMANRHTPRSSEEASQIDGVPPNNKNILVTERIIQRFEESKLATDQFIEKQRLSNYVNQVLPKTTELCVVHILDAFDELGCSIRNAKPGQTIDKIKYIPRHQQFVDFLYELLEKTARLIDIDGSKITRTFINAPTKSAQILLQALLRDYPSHEYDYKLTYLTGARLAECLTGKSDALQLIFGTREGREIASGMYSKSPINLAWINQMEEFLRSLLSTMSLEDGPIKILEMGAGTGGTTSVMAPLFADLDVPVEYTVTDLSPSLVAGARKRFKQYPFMKYKTIDTEKPPPEDTSYSQHIITATNCVHATHSLVSSTQNIHGLLRPDGFLMMLEMTETLPWVDLIFGLIEGWWLFDDGRRHALVHPSAWAKTLQQVGYGHVDWTQGNCPEANVQRIIIALASGHRYDRKTLENPQTLALSQKTDFAARQAAVDAFVEKYTEGFHKDPNPSTAPQFNGPTSQCVLVTGATGSLGSHLVAHLASQSNIKTVVCLNRPSSMNADLRQHRAFNTREITLSLESLIKLKILEAETSKPKLGLSATEYDDLAKSVTHIVHNAWPMSITRPIRGFESQFAAMQNLINLARDIVTYRGLL